MKTPVRLALTLPLLALALVPPADAAEAKIRIELSIPSAAAPTGLKGEALYEEMKLNDTRAQIVLTATSGRKAKVRSMKEFIAPTAFDPFEIAEGASLTHRTDGSVLVASLPQKVKGMSAVFPVTPPSPTAFETFDVGWELEATPTLTADGLIIVEALARRTAATSRRAYFGEGTGPVVAKVKGRLGRENEVVVTENRAQLAVRSVSEIPLVIRARPGVSYPVQLILDGNPVEATVTCSLVSK
jgi:hypothetical protein